MKKDPCFSTTSALSAFQHHWLLFLSVVFQFQTISKDPWPFAHSRNSSSRSWPWLCEFLQLYISLHWDFFNIHCIFSWHTIKPPCFSSFTGQFLNGWHLSYFPFLVFIDLCFDIEDEYFSPWFYQADHRAFYSTVQVSDTNLWLRNFFLLTLCFLSLKSKAIFQVT